MQSCCHLPNHQKQAIANHYQVVHKSAHEWVAIVWCQKFWWHSTFVFLRKKKLFKKYDYTLIKSPSVIQHDMVRAGTTNHIHVLIIGNVASVTASCWWCCQCHLFPNTGISLVGTLCHNQCNKRKQQNVLHLFFWLIAKRKRRKNGNNHKMSFMVHNVALAR